MKIVLVGIVLLIVIGVIYFVKGVHPGNSITLSGKAVCLPHKGTSRVQTAECALGMRTNDGKYYGFLYIPKNDITILDIPPAYIQCRNGHGVCPNPASTNITVVGTVVNPPSNDLYNVIGNIAIKSLSVVH